jgi:hypothetical protein
MLVQTVLRHSAQPVNEGDPEKALQAHPTWADVKLCRKPCFAVQGEPGIVSMVLVKVLND